MKAREIQPGDVLDLPGWMLHEDLAGLRFEIRAEEVETADGLIFVRHQDGKSKTWFYPEDDVRRA